MNNQQINNPNNQVNSVFKGTENVLRMAEYLPEGHHLQVMYSLDTDEVFLEGPFVLDGTYLRSFKCFIYIGDFGRDVTPESLNAKIWEVLSRYKNMSNYS